MKKQVDPNLHFSIFTGKGDVPFIIGLFIIKNLSIPLLQEVYPLFNRDDAMELLMLGRLVEQPIFSEAVYDLTLNNEIEYEATLIQQLLKLIPKSRMSHFLSKYEDYELVELINLLYSVKDPSTLTVLAHKKELLFYMNTGMDGSNTNLLMQMNPDLVMIEKKIEIKSEEDKKKYLLDYEIMKLYLKVKTPVSSSDAEALLAKGKMGEYFLILDQWKNSLTP